MKTRTTKSDRSLPGSSPFQPRLFAAATLLAVVTAICYWPVKDAGFINFDDPDYVSGNDHVGSGLTRDNVVWALTRGHSANWHPLTWISHMVDVEAFGMKPRGHHLVNVGLHIVNVLLLFGLLRRFTGQIAPSLIVAALFAVHPLNVESVAWISQRKTTLSTLFALLSLWSYSRYALAEVTSGRWRAYALSLFLFALSLASKQMMVTMPFALLLWDYWPLERKEFATPPGASISLGRLVRGWLRLFPEKLPYLALAVLASMVTVVVQTKAMQSIDSFPLNVRLGNVIIAYASYLWLLVWPHRLAVFYPLHTAEITAGPVAIAAAVLLLVTLFVGWQGRRRRYLIFGWFWFLGTMVPVIGLVQVGSQSMADRYMYVPGWGLTIAVVWLAWDALQTVSTGRGARVAATTATVAILLLFSYRSFLQARVWHDSITLFEDAAAQTDRNWQAHITLADEYLSNGKARESVAHCEEGLKLGHTVRLMSIYGLALYETGQPDRAIETLETAIRNAPDQTMGYTNLGWVYTRMGKFPQAARQFELASQRLSGSEDRETRRTIYANWAFALAQANRLDEASEKYELALAIDPQCQFLLCDAGGLDLQQNKTDRAVERLTRAVALEPTDANAAYLLARGLAAQGKSVEAAQAFTRAAELNPHNTDAVAQAANLLLKSGRRAEAASILEKALGQAAASDDPKQKVVASTLQVQLANLAISEGNVAAAIRRFDQALVDWPDNYLANNNLAWVLATTPDAKIRNGARAVELARHACTLVPGRDYSTLGTLAAALAANSEYQEAATTAREARDLAAKGNDQRSVTALNEQLALYEQGRPYLEK